MATTTFTSSTTTVTVVSTVVASSGSSSNNAAVGAAAGGGLCALLIVFFAVLYVRKRRAQQPDAKPVQVRPHDIIAFDLAHKSSFGSLSVGTTSKGLKVNVRKPPASVTSRGRTQFIHEIELLKALGSHANIARLESL